MNITELIADLQLHFPASDPKEVAKALLAQQVCLKQKDAALQRCTKFTQEDYDALALQPDLSALREHDAEVVEDCYHAVREAILTIDGVALTATQLLSIYEQLTTPIRVYAERIRKGEAA